MFMAITMPAAEAATDILWTETALNEEQSFAFYRVHSYFDRVLGPVYPYQDATRQHVHLQIAELDPLYLGVAGIPLWVPSEGQLAPTELVITLNSLYADSMPMHQFRQVVFHEISHFLGWHWAWWQLNESVGTGIQLIDPITGLYNGPALDTFELEYGDIPFAVSEGHLGREWATNEEGVYVYLGDDAIDLDDTHVMDADYNEGSHVNLTYWAVIADTGREVDWSQVEVGLLEDVLPNPRRRRGPIVIVTELMDIVPH